jgi:hypothetical protein
MTTVAAVAEVVISDELLALREIVDAWQLENAELLKDQKRILVRQRRLVALSNAADKIIAAKARAERLYTVADLI